MLETLTIEHVPSTYAIHICLFLQVRNAIFLREQLLARNPEFEYAFMDASAVLSRVHVLAAIFKAICNAQNGALRTPNVHSEAVISLSPSSNIADAYRKFGVSASTTSLLVVKIVSRSSTETSPSPPASAETSDLIWHHLAAHVEGTPVPLTDEHFTKASNLKLVRKNYKLGGLGWLEKVQDENVKREEIEKLVLGAMALRGL